MASEDEQLEAGGVDGRTLALSDGVFAIAMTLLVLAIGEPDPAHGQSVAGAIWDHKGEALAWLWSFAVLFGSAAFLVWFLLPWAIKPVDAYA